MNAQKVRLVGEDEAGTRPTRRNRANYRSFVFYSNFGVLASSEGD